MGKTMQKYWNNALSLRFLGILRSCDRLPVYAIYIFIVEVRPNW